MSGIATDLNQLVRMLIGVELPVRLRASDGSEAGPVTDPTVAPASPRGLTRLLWSPCELGFAQIYVTGDIDVEGDPASALDLVKGAAGPNMRIRYSPTPSKWANMLGLETIRNSSRCCTIEHGQADASSSYRCHTGTKIDPGGGRFISRSSLPIFICDRLAIPSRCSIERGGLAVREVQALREHYVHTTDHWIERFETNQTELAAYLPEESVRAWRLFLVGGRRAFRDGRMRVDQVLVVRPGDNHRLPVAVRSR